MWKGRCWPSHVADLAVTSADPEHVLAKLEEGCCPIDADFAKPPHITSVRLSSENDAALDTIVARLMASDYPKANYRMAVHGAICVVADWPDADLRAVLPQ
ncbi:MAG: hypothetical protein AAGH90_12060 [Pseudomonadota bacterium]